VQNATFDSMLKKMRGVPGTHVKLTVRRPNACRSTPASDHRSRAPVRSSASD
jgi:C-terminal processing protease CtpA/Prc